MSVSYRSFGTYPNIRQEIVGTLAEIIGTTGLDGMYACPTDVYGCSLEYRPGYGWTGFVGQLPSQALADSLPAGLAAGATASVLVDGTYVLEVYGFDGQWTTETPLPMLNDLVKVPWSPTSRYYKLDRASPSFDAFGRYRVGTIETIFDSKLSSGKLPAYWDEVIVGGGSSTHVPADSCVNMTVTGNGQAVIRQTKQRWNYQPGKSQLLLSTFKMPTAQGVTSRVGLVHGNYASPHTIHDGLYFQVANGVASVNIAKGTESGGLVSTETAIQADWNMDKLDGTGPSGKVADWSKAQILAIDFQWLGIGGVRFGIEVDSVLVYVHEFMHAGIVESVYMHNGTQPVRYEIRSTGGTGTLSHICSTVMSGGGTQKTGISTCVDTNGTSISCAPGSIQLLLALRIPASDPDVQLLIEKVYALNTAANSSYRWVLLLNPTITGAVSYVADASTGLEIARNGGTNITLTGGMLLDSGYASRDNRSSASSTNPAVNPGISIAGTPEVVAFGIEAIGGTATCSGGIGTRILV